MLLRACSAWRATVLHGNCERVEVWIYVLSFEGFKFFGGQGVGDQTKTCESDGDYCYNMTATSGMLLNVAKAGCSTYRCIVNFYRFGLVDIVIDSTCLVCQR